MGAAGKQVLLLWDVDHTLIENSGVSKAVYARAFQMMTGDPEVQPGTDGRTDHEIVRNLFTAKRRALSRRGTKGQISPLYSMRWGNAFPADAGRLRASRCPGGP